ncbi:helix-turn-helix domain-containing protein [Reichenbachiella agariperforans]|uniref:helix-turn-helix domain-containing protein n=1 Tax=Reichenbachiella agariperforans TaxID=156994 RepID=UPI001C080B97|nr:helix-turn-helix transcriptional regulator [Reichenbachiella agariperforans]MBU2914149.1 helix-turn-helix transcriptional regulator [Reichenbachiella agariperforans]
MSEQEFIEAFRTTLKDLRQMQKLSQEKLAFKAGLHPTYISLLERGKRKPTLFVIFKITKHLGVTPSSFVNNIQEELLKENEKG